MKLSMLNNVLLTKSKLYIILVPFNKGPPIGQTMYLLFSKVLQKMYELLPILQ